MPDPAIICSACGRSPPDESFVATDEGWDHPTCPKRNGGILVPKVDVGIEDPDDEPVSDARTHDIMGIEDTDPTVVMPDRPANRRREE